jgi:hypothetical protein
MPTEWTDLLPGALHEQTEWTDLHQDEQDLLVLTTMFPVALVDTGDRTTPRLDHLAHVGLIEAAPHSEHKWEVRSTRRGRQLCLASMPEDALEERARWIEVHTGAHGGHPYVDEFYRELTRRRGMVN